MADPVYQDQPYMRKSFLFFSDVYLTGAVHMMTESLFIYGSFFRVAKNILVNKIRGKRGAIASKGEMKTKI